MSKKKSVPLPDNPNNAETLEAFAKGVEKDLEKGLGPFALRRLWCRMLSAEGQQQWPALSKFTEMRYGKPTERHEHTGPEGGPMSVEHTIKFGDGSTER